MQPLVDDILKQNATGGYNNYDRSSSSDIVQVDDDDDDEVVTSSSYNDDTRNSVVNSPKRRFANEDSLKRFPTEEKYSVSNIDVSTTQTKENISRSIQLF
jgi:hypothetical protein